MQHRSDAGRGEPHDAFVASDRQSTFDEADRGFMARALELAERGRRDVAPNPMVGCVVVADGEIVGEGWHQRPGEPHAEVHALRAAGEHARGAIAYVTLEPCDHHGRTPPCSEALLAAGLARVVAAVRDPNPAVDGRGLERLRSGGVDVAVGLLEGEARRQNAAYFTHRALGRPWVRYKTAMTLDGKIATRTGQSRWITGEAARERVQRWRSESSVVAVGVSTVLLDDPRLTARTPGGRSPHKVVFDSVARTPPTAALFEADETGATASVTLVVGPAAPAARIEALRDRGAEVVIDDDGRGRPSVRGTLEHLAASGRTSVLLEGGGTLAWSFLEAHAIDRVAWFIGPMLLGGKGASPLGGLGVARIAHALHLDDLTVGRVGDDLLIEGDVHYGAAHDDGRYGDAAGASVVAGDAGRVEPATRGGG